MSTKSRRLGVLFIRTKKPVEVTAGKEHGLFQPEEMALTMNIPFSASNEILMIMCNRWRRFTLCKAQVTFERRGCSQTHSLRRYWKFRLPIYFEIQGPHCSLLLWGLLVARVCGLLGLGGTGFTRASLCQLKRIYNHGHNSSGQYCNIHIFLSFLGSLIKMVHPFWNFLAVPPPPTLYKAETQKKILDTHV